MFMMDQAGAHVRPRWFRGSPRPTLGRVRRNSLNKIYLTDTGMAGELEVNVAVSAGFPGSRDGDRRIDTESRRVLFALGAGLPWEPSCPALSNKGSLAWGGLSLSFASSPDRVIVNEILIRPTDPTT